MCTVLTFIHSYCSCISYDVRVCTKLPRRCPSCPRPGASKYITQPSNTPPFIPESLSSCPSFTDNPTQFHPLPCPRHLREISPQTRRQIIFGPPPSQPIDECGSSDGIAIDASGKVRKTKSYQRTHTEIKMPSPKGAGNYIEPEPWSVGLLERYGDGEWRERTVAEILEDGRAEDGGGFKKERVEPGKLVGAKPWYSPCRWVCGKR